MQLMDYNIASWVLSKTLSLSYFVAFLSLLPQVLGLFGYQGLLSIDHLLNILDKEMKSERFYHMPSLFWFASSDMSIKAVCFVGMTAASLAFMGFSQSFMLAICFVCYLSFVSTGQIFLNYQWDNLLLEFGFLGLFFAPWTWEWIPFGAHILHPVVYFLVLFLLFKLMFLSGAAKLANKDTCWKDLTALSYHYWTQPLPTPLAYFASKLPLRFHRVSALMMFFIELCVPFFIFVPGKLQTLAVILLVTLQVLIMLTGNYAFFNFLTLGLCLAVLPDSTWGFKINWLQPSTLPDALAITLAVFLVAPALFWLYKTVFEKSKALDFMMPSLRFFYPFRISNPYGLFAIMTRSRPELVLEGSNDGVTWQEYEFTHKVTSLSRRPPVVAPHQPRLDWQMWFAALETFNDNLWLQNLIARIFQESPDVLMLFAKDPFNGKAPKSLRIMKYHYSFSDWNELNSKGLWWKRELAGPYSPIFHREPSEDESAPIV